MELRIEPYATQRSLWPAEGRHILAQFDEEGIVVYQAYSRPIGHLAARHGHFGGDFSYSRMSWIKPNFLWMMYRSGWGTKENQEVTLAVRLRREFFDYLLAQAVPSTFDRNAYPHADAWRKAVAVSHVRLQWDPDHGPSGAPQRRRALQLGLRGPVLQEYGKDAILSIEDISDFVLEQRDHARSRSGELRTPSERVYRPREEIARHLDLEQERVSGT